MNFLRVILLASCVCGSSLGAGEAVLVTLRGIEFAPGKLEEILRVEKADRRYEVMAEEVERGRALDVETVVLQTIVNGKAEALSGREVIYPTEYASELQGCNPAAPQPIFKKEPYIPGAILKFEGVTAFETRTTGSTSELLIQRMTDDSFAVKLFHEFVTQEADRVAQSFEFFEGNRMTMAMPQFRTNQISVSALAVGDGQWTLSAVLDSWRKDAPAGSKIAVWINVESLSPSK